MTDVTLMIGFCWTKPYFQISSRNDESGGFWGIKLFGAYVGVVWVRGTL